MSDSPILVDTRDDGVALITLNRPDRLNAMSADLLAQLADALRAAAADPAVRCVAITGAGRAFSAGGDVKAMAADRRAVTFGGETDEEASGLLARAAQSTTGAIYALPKPVVALVNGVVVGGALGLVLACDVRLATRRARLGTAFRNVGLSGDFGTTYLLPRLVGWGRARELFLSGDLLGADAAQQLGLVTAVYDDDTFLSRRPRLLRPARAGPHARLRPHEGQPQLRRGALAHPGPGARGAQPALQRPRPRPPRRRRRFRQQAGARLPGAIIQPRGR